MISYNITYRWTLKDDTKKLIYETESRTQRANLRLTKGRGWRRGKGGTEFGISRYKEYYTENGQTAGPTAQHGKYIHN